MGAFTHFSKVENSFVAATKSVENFMLVYLLSVGCKSFYILLVFMNEAVCDCALRDAPCKAVLCLPTGLKCQLGGHVFGNGDGVENILAVAVPLCAYPDS